MITTSKAYVTSDGLAFPSLDLAKIHELELLCKDCGDIVAVVRQIVTSSDVIIPLLRKRERKPRTPSVKPAKAKRTRKPKVAVDAESATA